MRSFFHLDTFETVNMKEETPGGTWAQCWQVTATQEYSACSVSLVDGFALTAQVGYVGNTNTTAVTFYFSMSPVSWCNTEIDITSLSATTTFYESGDYDTEATMFYIGSQLFIAIESSSGTDLTVSDVVITSVSTSGPAVTSGGTLSYSENAQNQGYVINTGSGVGQGTVICFTIVVDPELYSPQGVATDLTVTTGVQMSYTQLSIARSVSASVVKKVTVGTTRLMTVYAESSTVATNSAQHASLAAIWTMLVAIIIALI